MEKRVSWLRWLRRTTPSHKEAWSHCPIGLVRTRELQFLLNSQLMHIKQADYIILKASSVTYLGTSASSYTLARISVQANC